MELNSISKFSNLKFSNEYLTESELFHPDPHPQMGAKTKSFETQNAKHETQNEKRETQNAKRETLTLNFFLTLLKHFNHLIINI